MSTIQQTDVLIIGAGPSGSSAAALLRQKGYQVTIIEKQHFPRFSIGESLLPQSMVFLEEAGLLDTVRTVVNVQGDMMISVVVDRYTSEDDLKTDGDSLIKS